MWHLNFEIKLIYWREILLCQMWFLRNISPFSLDSSRILLMIHQKWTGQENKSKSTFLLFLIFFCSLSFKRSIFQTFWKLHCVTKSLLFKLETSNFGYLLIFWFCWAVQSFSKIGKHWYYTFYKGPPFDVFWFFNLPKIQRGDPYKMSNINVVQSCWNFAQLSKIKK